MRIWLFNPYGQIPGEGWRDGRFTLLSSELASRGHKVILWAANFSHTFKTFRSPSWKTINISENFRIRLVPTGKYEKNVSLGRIRFEATYAWNCYKGTNDFSAPDCIVATDPSQIVGFLGVRLAKKYSVPLIIDVFDMWPELFTLALPRVLRPFSRQIFFPFHMAKAYNLSRADALVSLCRTYLDQVYRMASRRRKIPSATIFNGIDVNAFLAGTPTADAITQMASRLGKKDGAIWAVYTGSLGNNYDVQTLIDASEILAKRSSRVEIVVLGEGPLRKDITDFIAKTPHAKIRFLGTGMSSTDLLCLYKVSDIALCAYSKHSNVAMPNKAYDYLAAGMPVVNSLRGELEEFLLVNKIGVQYIAGDPSSLADAVEKLADDPIERRRMAENSFRQAHLFDTAKLYPRYASFIEQVKNEFASP